jgi:LmbE family N-acetylglucosaminyl deacetylase
MSFINIKPVFYEFVTDLPGDCDIVYAPALEHGHPEHDVLHYAAIRKYGNRCQYYSTYRSKDDLQPTGKINVEHTPELERLKIKALQCYKSQIKATPCHFNLKCWDEYLI